jgi:hypothetical protein
LQPILERKYINKGQTSLQIQERCELPSEDFVFLVSQLMMLLLLAMRFSQRAVAVASYVKQMAEPVVETAPVSVVVAPMAL